MSNTIFDNIKRSNIRTGNTGPLLTSFDWGFKFTKVPALLDSFKDTYLNELFMSRAVQVQVPEDPVNQVISVMIHGHRFSQIGDTPAYGSFRIQFTDFSDLTISKMFTLLLYSASDPLTKVATYVSEAHPKEYLFDINIYRFDPALNQVKTWVCQDCLVTQCDMQESMVGEKQPIGSGVVGFTTDFYTIEYNTADNLSYYNFAGDTFNT